jgi:hypothetical protein
MVFEKSTQPQRYFIPSDSLTVEQIIASLKIAPEYIDFGKTKFHILLKSSGINQCKHQMPNLLKSSVESFTLLPLRCLTSSMALRVSGLGIGPSRRGRPAYPSV